MIVVDANVIGYLYLAGERSSQAELALMKDPVWAAPLLWRSEFSNVLAMYMRKNRLALDIARKIMEEALYLMNGREYESDLPQVLTLANDSGCSSYDCEFVALAKELNIPLVTVDEQILARFPEVAVALGDFAGK